MNANQPKVLLVDDEPNVLLALKRQLRGEYNIELADNTSVAFECIKTKGPYPVVVSDMRMPDLSGVEFLKKVAAISPNTVRLMLTGNADQSTAIEAVNEASVFRFLTKPCTKEDMVIALDAAIVRYETNISEKVLLEETLTGVIDLMSNILSVVDPTLFGRINHSKNLIKALAQSLDVKNSWSLEVAAMISQMMAITLPDDIRKKMVEDIPLLPGDVEVLNRMPDQYRQLLDNIPRLKPVTNTLYYSLKNYDGSSAPQNELAEKDIPAPSRIIRILTALQERKNNSDRKTTEILAEMHRQTDKFDPDLVERIHDLASLESKNRDIQQKEITADMLMPGLLLVSDLQTKFDRLLLLRGQVITETQLNLISNYIVTNNIAEPITVVEMV